MNVDKALRIQKNARDNVNTVKSYLTDLQNWETEMKRKEAASRGEFEQELPPVRSKAKKEKPTVPVKKKPAKRISGSDYTSWDKFDVDKACEDVDMEDVGPPSLDGKKSSAAKLEKLREEAQYEKERGNDFVKKEKWDEAIACYNRAIELVKDDAIYYANRGLCHLKRESLHQAESDCTEALRLDPTYVKAYQRRAAARQKLGSLRAATNDLTQVLQLEPRNADARRLLAEIKARMGTKGTKSKSSPLSTPTAESKPIATTARPKIVELDDDSPGSVPTQTVPKKQTKTEVKAELSPLENWRNGVGENVNVLKTVKKPPHMRSKRALRSIPIKEIQLGKQSPEKQATRMKIIEIEGDPSAGDTNNNRDIAPKDDIEVVKDKGAGDTKSSQLNRLARHESEKLQAERLSQEKPLECDQEKPLKLDSLTAPVNSVQFMSEWKNLNGSAEARSHYLSLIDPSKLPSIFANALESDILSDVILVIHKHRQKFVSHTVTAYLQGLVGVKRFSALAMFLSDSDKELVNKLLVHCRTVDGCTEEEIADLKNKFEI